MPSGNACVFSNIHPAGHHASVTGGGAKAERARLKQHDITSNPRQADGGMQSGVTRTDHNDVGTVRKRFGRKTGAVVAGNMVPPIGFGTKPFGENVIALSLIHI